MQPDEIQAVFRRHWKPGWGSVTAAEADYIQSLIRRHQPRTFLEIGTASSLSGGLIARFLDENGGESFTTLDHDNTFFGDTSKENGFLLPRIYQGSAVKVSQLPFRTALAVPQLNQTFDMAFIDANHQHPWPTIDTLCVFPFMTGSKIVVHHDLRLFRNQDATLGIGPKYLFDQFPTTHRERAAANHGNTFFLDLSLSVTAIESLAADAFSLPWSLRTPLHEQYVFSFQTLLRDHYSPVLRDVFDHSLARFNRISLAAALTMHRPSEVVAWLRRRFRSRT